MLPSTEPSMCFVYTEACLTFLQWAVGRLLNAALNHISQPLYRIFLTVSVCIAQLVYTITMNT